MRPTPTTLEIVETLALQDPTRPALREDGVELNYGQFAAMLMQCAAQLQRLGVQPGQRVAVAGPGFGMQLVLLLACEAVGAVTASFQAEDDGDAAFLFTQVDWVFSGVPQVVPSGTRFVLVDSAFIRALAQPLQAEPAWSPADLHAPQRITRTSGSSGASKFMLLLRHAQETFTSNPLDVNRFTRDTRLLVLGPLVINGVFARASNCLRQGGMLLIGHGQDIAQLAPTAIFGLPAQLQRLLDEVPAGYVAPQPVHIGTVGGLVPPTLRERAQSVFGGRLWNRYGSNETGPICDDLDAAGTGLLTPGVDVRIVDDQGQSVPAGQFGVVVVRTPTMAEGYLDRPEETAAVFRDGWFVTGDVGALVGRRKLRLRGRHDDLVNVGGIKVPAAEIEQRLRAQAGVADAAVLAVHLDGGAVSIGVALVAAPGVSADEAVARVQQVLRLGADAVVRVLVLSAVPRLASGKVDRMAVLRLFR